MDLFTNQRHRAPTVGRLLVCGVACAAFAACSGSSKEHGTGGAGGTGGTGGTSSASESSSSSASSGTGIHDDCTTLCTTEQKTCPKTVLSACESACETTKSSVTWCKQETAAATDCLAKQPASSFQCDTNGQAAAKSGVCSTELTAMQTCWYTGPPSGLPDLTQACTTSCANESALSCADPMCATNCENSVKPGPKCNGAFAALVACAAMQTAEDFACNTAKTPRPNLKPGFCGFQELLLYACLK